MKLKSCQEVAINAETFNGLMQQVSRLTLCQRALLRKRLDEVGGHLDNYLGRFRCMDTHHANSREGILAMALGKFPHLTVT